MSDADFNIWWRDFDVPREWYEKWIMCGGTDTRCSSRFAELEDMFDFLTDVLPVVWQAAESTPHKEETK